MVPLPSFNVTAVTESNTMSLNWSIEDIKDWEQISMDAEKNGLEATKTNALIWATMSVDLPGITAKNVDEFYWRIKVLEQKSGPFIWRYGGEGEAATTREAYEFTREDIERRIGLSTNVSTKPRIAWVSRIVKGLEREGKLGEQDKKSVQRELLASAPKAVKKATKGVK